jgi:Fe-S-cluster containining protein
LIIVNVPLRQAVHAAAIRPEVRQAVHALYAEVQEQIERRKPACSASGRCCRFEEYGHRLYVTTLELAAFVRDLEDNPGMFARFYDPAGWGGKGCLFQQAKLCGVHGIRPFGCRIFFCDETAEQWQREQYEAFHGKLKRMHGELEVDYYYVEWREALRTLRPEKAHSAAVGLDDKGPRF